MSEMRKEQRIQGSEHLAMWFECQPGVTVTDVCHGGTSDAGSASSRDMLA